MVFWKPPYQKLFASRVLPVIVFQNYRLLELAGEPVHLLIRVHAEYCGRRVVKTINSVDLVVEGDFVVWHLWVSGINDVDEFPDIRDIGIRIDGVDCVNVYAPEYVVDVHHFYVRDLRLEEGHRVDVFFKKEVRDVNRVVECEYDVILPDFDAVTGQTYPGEGAHSKYGWRQFRWRGVYYQGKVLRDAFLLAFPDLRRDLALERRGFGVESRYDCWTSPPPFAPLVNEHDVIVRLNGLRYEIRNVTRNLVDGVLVQQDFEVSEVSPSNAVYNVEVDSLKGPLKGFPGRRIYSGE
jgi:hypothetical protein